MLISYAFYYELFNKIENEKNEKMQATLRPRSQFQAFLQSYESKSEHKDGFSRMQQCRDALSAIDGQGWNRSFHQRMFHDHFIRSCARIFFKTEPPGSFARAHQAILEKNSWDTLSQEVLISTPRRFGKTISVSMFAAAIVYRCLLLFLFVNTSAVLKLVPMFAGL